MKPTRRDVLCRTCRAIAALCLFVASTSLTFADDAKKPEKLKPGSPFSDHMVLQRGMAVPVWGAAAPGAEVIVTFAGQSKAAKADDSGRWLVKLDALEANAESRVLAITCGAEKQEIKDVVVGEVWFASGQSNMQMGVSEEAIK